jgi:hypothetical protein
MTTQVVWRAVCILSAGIFAALCAGAQQDDLGCGPRNEKFDLVVQKDRPIPQPAPDKALVIVFPDRTPRLGSIADKQRLGLNGKWMGMTTRNTYFFFETEPGLLRLCEDSKWRPLYLTAQPGQVYYIMLSPAEASSPGPHTKSAKVSAPIEIVSAEKAQERLQKLRYATIELKH